MKDQTISKKEILKKVWIYIRSYRMSVIFSAILALAVAILSLYLPILVGEGIDRIVAPGKVDFSGLRLILITIVRVTVITSLLQWWMNRINYKITYHVVGDMCTDVLCCKHCTQMSAVYIHHQFYIIMYPTYLSINQFSLISEG